MSEKIETLKELKQKLCIWCCEMDVCCPTLKNGERCNILRVIDNFETRLRERIIELYKKHERKRPTYDVTELLLIDEICLILGISKENLKEINEVMFCHNEKKLRSLLRIPVRGRA